VLNVCEYFYLLPDGVVNLKPTGDEKLETIGLRAVIV
jgi:hypothetical protein